MAEVQLKAHNFLSAIGPCMRCLAAAEHSSFSMQRARALLQLVAVKLHMQNLAAALHLAEEATPIVMAAKSSQLRGELSLLQAKIVISIASAVLQSDRKRSDSEPAETSEKRSNAILAKAVPLLMIASENLGATQDSAVIECNYLLARLHHQLGNVVLRNRHAQKVREAHDGAALDAAVAAAPPHQREVKGELDPSLRRLSSDVNVAMHACYPLTKMIGDSGEVMRGSSSEKRGARQGNEV